MKTKNNIYLYIYIVLLPVLLLSIVFFNQILKDDIQNRRNNAKWIGSIYEKNWDQFIAETMTSLKVLAITSEENLNNLNEVQPLLKETSQSDPRYGGLYLLDSHGNLLKGSNLNETNFINADYIREVLKTNDTIISNHVETLKNDQKVLGLATPVMNEKNERVGLLVAQLRIDYMKNLMKVLTPDSKLYVVNGTGIPFLKVNVNKKELKDMNSWISIPMDRLPWNIMVKMADRNMNEIAKAFGKVFILIFINANILFLIIVYLLLRKNAIKERKENELQKLELIGTLASSTAHEIRNPLTGVMGLLQLLKEKYTDLEDRYYFDVIDTELRRINDIVSEFLVLGKPTAQVMEVVNVAETLQELKPLILSEGNGRNVKCDFQIPDKPVFTYCVKAQLKQVILNITRNAFESIDDSGKLAMNLYSFSDVCKLEIIDNGKGIPKKDLEKVFQPFFTSKESGTGLGLVICKRIIHTFGGNIEIHSTESVGTNVEITLPIIKSKRA
jgi:two-component system, sporulation sensor kinase D